MSFLRKAFPPGRPYHRAHASSHAVVTIVVTFVALVAALLPLSSPAAGAGRPADEQQQAHRQPRPHVRAKPKPKPKHRKPKHQKPKQRPKPKAKPRIPGQPPKSYVVPATSLFSYPNRSRAERLAIRSRVLRTINSTWGGRRTSIGTPRAENGTIRIATWSFDDWDIARALVAARKRGVSVQVVAAKGANKDHPAWQWLRKRLGHTLVRRGFPTTRETVSFARSCGGACRGWGGTPHAKYFLFRDVGRAHLNRVSFQTSSNLTYMAYQGQWNEATVSYNPAVYDDFMAVFRQARLGKPVSRPYHVAAFGPVTDYFFPRPSATAAQDPVMQMLNGVSCRGATVGTADGRTRIRIVQYAIYNDRGVWIAKKLRALWRAGCDIKIIYSVCSRPVLSILRNPAGRGPIPMRQSVVKDYWGNIVTYNHSKWMTVTGRVGPSLGTYQTFNGSANWSNLAFSDDEQMQRISNRIMVLSHNAAFNKTWRQPTSKEPTYARVATFGRTAVVVPFARDVPAGAPAFGTGVFRYMTRD